MPKTTCEMCHGVLSPMPKVSLEKVIEHHEDSCPGALHVKKAKAAKAAPAPEPELEAPVRRVRKRVVTRL